MEKRVCKNSGLELSVLGTGCWAFGGGDYWGDQDQKDVNRVVHASENPPETSEALETLKKLKHLNKKKFKI